MVSSRESSTAAEDREFYLAVFSDVVQLIERFEAAAGRHATFPAKVEAVLDESVRCRTMVPAVAGFALPPAGAVACDPDLSGVLASAWARCDSFLGELVAAGIDTGEVPVADRAVIGETLMTLVMGLLVSNGVPEAQARALEGAKRLLAGTLLVSSAGTADLIDTGVREAGQACPDDPHWGA